MAKQKALKATISGYYVTSNGKDIIDFEDVVGYLPLVDEEHANMHIRGRYASEWVRNDVDKDGERIYKTRIDRIQQCFIDDLEECTHDFSYVGKDIKAMSDEEMQDLATAKDLRSIPIPKRMSGMSIRDVRTKAYVEYSLKVLGQVIDPKEKDFNFSKLNPLIVDGHARVETSKKITNDEILDMEEKSSSTESLKSNLTLQDLKAMANEKGIQFHPNIGFDALHAKLFNG